MRRKWCRTARTREGAQPNPGAARLQAGEIAKLNQSLQLRARLFLGYQQALHQFLDGEQRYIANLCETVLNPPNLDGLDEWEKVLAHFTSDFDPTWDCDLEFGLDKVVGVKFDWSDTKFKNLNVKLLNVKYKIDLTSRRVTVDGTYDWEGASEIDIDKVSGKPNVVQGNEQLVAAGIGAEGQEGPFFVKGNVTVISDNNPNTGVKEPGVVFTGSEGIGLGTRKGALGGLAGKVRCFPGTGTVKVYPRGLLQDAVNFLVAASHNGK